MWEEELDFTIRLVDSICTAIERVVGEPEAVEIVGVTDTDVTRRVDRVAEEEAIKYIQETGTPAILISEESPPQRLGPYPKVDKAVILDPLDGSTNFSRGIPFSSVSAALASLNDDEETLSVQVGVVKDLDRGDSYYAVKEGGAFVNGSRLKNTMQVNKTKPLVSLYAYDGEAALRAVKLQNYCNVRTFGSIALELSYLAASKLDGVIDIRDRIRLQDMAAGKLILEESGGVISDDQGRSLNMKIGGKYSIVASNSMDRLEWLIDLIQKVS